MTEQERYDTIDLLFYREQIAPMLPATVLDFHAHAWLSRQWKDVPWESGAAGAKYMVTLPDYGIEQLLADAARIIPDRPCHAVCFGYPTPAANLVKTNVYIAGAGRAHRGLYPLAVVGRGTSSRAELERLVLEDGCFGYKVYLNWFGNDYADIGIEDMIGPEEMALAEALGLVVLLHVPRAGRLADPEVQRGVRALAREYPNSRIVLAHCGRCYLPDEMTAAISAIADLENVYLDTSMVMDPTVLEVLFQRIDARRVLFATDFPVAAMRGRRVYVMDHWVDVVLEGYPESEYRVASNGIHATFMVYEIILAIRRAAERAGLPAEVTRGIFYDNGIAVLRHVHGGKQLAATEGRA